MGSIFLIIGYEARVYPGTGNSTGRLSRAERGISPGEIAAIFLPMDELFQRFFS
jgi:hypothetical protein